MHVHLEGAIQPETLVKLAKRNDITLPISSADEFRDWYRFTGFSHFAEVYQTLSRVIRTPEDLSRFSPPSKSLDFYYYANVCGATDIDSIHDDISRVFADMTALLEGAACLAMDGQSHRRSLG
ncbi:MAG: hypothetical protein JKY31_08780 [Rhodobacteraceae bacterium]|nr:hypothetical protein [Paracoccaceae bacterium]